MTRSIEGRAARARLGPRHVPRGRPSTVRIGDRPAVLEAIVDPAVDAVLWRRTLDPALARYCTDEAARPASQTRASGPRHEALARQLVAPATPRDARALLERDVGVLCERFFSLVAALPFAGATGASLDVIERDACRKLHADYVVLRLLCTYAGPGTDWVDGAFVDRVALVPSELDAREANPQIAPMKCLQRARVGDVLLLKGRAWPGALGAVHRSPPVEALGTRRLLLTLTCARAPRDDAHAGHPTNQETTP